MSSYSGFTTLATWLVQVSFLLAVIALGLCVIAAYRVCLGPLRKVPGPWYLKATSLFVRLQELNGTKRVWLHQLHVRYGSAVAISPREVDFASADAVRQIYGTGGKAFPKTELYNIFRQEGHTNLFTALSAAEHKDKRRLLADKYSNTGILRSPIPAIVEERAASFVNVCKQQRTVDIYLLCHAYALDCVSAALLHPFGTKSIDTEHGRSLVKVMSYRDSRVDLVLACHFPWLAWLKAMLWPNAADDFAESRTEVRNLTLKALQEDLSDFALAKRLLAQEGVDVESALAECLDHIGAGIDTTGDTLAWLLWELSHPRNAARVKRLRDELQQCTTSQQLEQLLFLGAVLQEALRLWAPGTLPLPRYTPLEGSMIDGIFTPGRTVVSSQSYTLHRLDENAFPEPNSFIPERWLEPKGNAERQRLFFAFGQGARTCVGKHLAMVELRAFLYAVYTNFETHRAISTNDADMTMDDELLTSRPRAMRCDIIFRNL